MMRKIIFTVILCWTSFSATSQEDWARPQVFKTNLKNGYITKDGKVIYKTTNNKMLYRAVYYEFYDQILYATTNYAYREGERVLRFIFRKRLKSDEFIQTVTIPSSPSPSYSSFMLKHNEKKQVTDHGLTYSVYRSGNFLELLNVKTLKGVTVIAN